MKKVLILLQNITSWGIYATFYDLLKKSPDFDVTVVLLHVKHHGQFADFRHNKRDENILKENNIDYILSFDEQRDQWLDIKGLKPDFVFFNTPYDEQRHPLYSVNRINRFAITCYIPYGITAAAVENLQFNLPFHQDVDMIFCETELHRSLFYKFCKINKEKLDKKLYVTQYPKLDYFLTNNVKIKSSKFFKSQDSLKLIWSPHWTFDKSSIGFSDFHKTYKYFLSLVKQNKNIEVILKPHPFLWNQLSLSNIMTHKEVENFKKDWLANENAQINEGGDYFELFEESDAIINSSISFMTEYIITGKQMLFLNGDNPRFNEFGQKLIEVLYQSDAADLKEIDSFIENVKNGIDSMKEERMKFINTYYDKNISSSQKILDILRKTEFKVMFIKKNMRYLIIRLIGIMRFTFVKFRDLIREILKMGFQYER